jgi:putative ABC transport system substrate-binding protein
MGLRLQSLAVRNTSAFDDAFSAAVRERAGAVLVLSTPLFMGGTKRLAELALAHKLPSLFGPRHHVNAGGLMSYSPDRSDLYRRGAIFVDKMLRGIDPADVPVEQPTKFQLVVNLRTAKAIGLAMSPTLIARADEVIE